MKLRQVTVRRDLFGAEGWGRDAARIRGEVHADFLSPRQAYERQSKLLRDAFIDDL